MIVVRWGINVVIHDGTTMPAIISQNVITKKCFYIDHISNFDPMGPLKKVIILFVKQAKNNVVFFKICVLFV